MKGRPKVDLFLEISLHEDLAMLHGPKLITFLSRYLQNKRKHFEGQIVYEEELGDLI